jgi:hypothetical protein
MASKAAQYLSPAQLAELSALTEGSLDPALRQAVQAWVASSPELLNLSERERAAVGVLHNAAAERAPARLRLRLQGQRVSPKWRSRVAGYAPLPARSRRRSWRWCWRCQVALRDPRRCRRRPDWPRR